MHQLPALAIAGLQFITGHPAGLDPVRDDVIDLAIGQLHDIVALQIRDFDPGLLVVLGPLAVGAMAPDAVLLIDGLPILDVGRVVLDRIAEFFRRCRRVPLLVAVVRGGLPFERAVAERERDGEDDEQFPVLYRFHNGLLVNKNQPSRFCARIAASCSAFAAGVNISSMNFFACLFAVVGEPELKGGCGLYST